MPTLCITGGATGLGKAIVQAFVAQGWNAIVLSRNEQHLQTLQQELGANKVTYYPCDIRDKAALRSAFAYIKDVDCLINNSGIGFWDNADKESLENIEDTIITNLIGAMRCTRLTLPMMIAKKSGVIINICSVAANEIFVHGSTYAASKAGLSMYAKVMREEVRENNIKVVNMYPGAVKTDIRDPEELTQYGNRMMEPNAVGAQVYTACINAMAGVVQEEIYIKPASGNVTF